MLVALMFTALETDPDPFFFTFVSLFFLGGVGCVAWALRNDAAQAIIGDVSLSAEPLRIPRGGSLKVQVEAPGLARQARPKGSLTLVAREIAIQGAGRSSVTHKDTLFSEKRPLLLPGESVPTTGRFTAEFTVPTDAPLSLLAESNTLEWEVELHIQAAEWLSLKQTIAIDVVPAVQATMPSALPSPAPTAPAEVDDFSGVAW